MTETVEKGGTRRPQAAREAAAIRSLARRLARAGVRPNRISQAGLLAAILSGAFLWAGGEAGSAPLLLLGACLAGLRLLANLLDGLVAIEGGLAEADGPFWNEVPDRLSDAAVLVGAGLAAGLPALGWAGAALAILTAYVREAGTALGLAADFRGPFAKPQRMAGIAAGAVIAALLLWAGVREGALALGAALWLVTLGTGLTAFRRALGLRAALLSRDRSPGSG
ncbi:MAG: CDP-alcohol phosphatidyltransferase family protein [Pseudomonadota bacterium]